MVWKHIELYAFLLHKCMILRRFEAEIVEQPVPKKFKKSFLRYFMRVSAVRGTKMNKMQRRSAAS